MKKDSYYFPHDYNSRNDEKILYIRSKYGIDGYGLYWMFIETMHEQEDGKLTCSLINGLSLNYNVDISVLNDFYNDAISVGLFVTDNNKFWSERVIRNKQEFNEKRERKSIAGKKGMQQRWHNNNTVITENNTVITKDNKGKKSKENEIKENKVEYIETRIKDFKDVTNYKNCQLYDYSELNGEFKKLYSELEWNAWKRFNKHLDENCEYIRKIENQIKFKEYLYLKKDFIDSKKITVERFLDLLEVFNNYKPATDKYNSVYVALKGWLKNEVK